jgi:hypothetical protein
MIYKVIFLKNNFKDEVYKCENCFGFYFCEKCYLTKKDDFKTYMATTHKTYHTFIKLWK